MSTRATYQITNAHGEDVFFYIHHDNYESGAALYLFNMHQAEAKRNCLAIRFILGNPGAVEFTKSHECHGDTEYRYTIDKDGLLTVHKDFYDEKTEEISFIEVTKNKHYAEFINKYLPEGLETEYNKKKHKLIHYAISLKPWALEDRFEWITIEALRTRMLDFYAIGTQYSETNPNRISYLKQAHEIDCYLQLVEGV